MKSVDIEKKAQQVLVSLNITSVPISVEEIARSKKIQISYAPSEDYSGLLIRKAGLSLMGVNSKEAQTRQRFTIAHELGHYFLHNNKDVFIEYRDNEDGEKVDRDIKEIQANIFAAALLMPRDLLEKDCKTVAKNGVFDEHHIDFLAKKYSVSSKAMSFRLINLKLTH